MATKLRGIAALALALAGSTSSTYAFDRTGPRPVIIGEVAFLPAVETRPEGGRAIFVRATIRAVEVGTDRELWSIPLRDAQAPTGDAIHDSIRTMARFSKGVLVKTSGGDYYVDRPPGPRGRWGTSGARSRNARSIIGRLKRT